MNMISCSASNKAVKDIKWERESFVKFETWFYKKVCDSDDDLSPECYKRQHGYTGSGSVVGRTFDGSYILTAAHLCDHYAELKNLNDINNELEADDEFTEIILVYKVKDIADFTYRAKIVGYDNQLDSCIAFVWGLFRPALTISNTGPVIGEEYYNVAAPAGFFEKDLVPLFEGRFIGDFRGADVYTIPAIGGSSGSPIINRDGELVGIIYARHNRFHHITLSTNYDKLKKFIFFTIKQHSESREALLDLKKERQVIINFEK
jgi:S1-C subfamily serine protease